MGMMRSRKNVGKHNLACYFGCCRECASKKQERRRIKRAEEREWKREVQKNYD
jgi:hypothetical protein